MSKKILLLFIYVLVIVFATGCTNSASDVYQNQDAVTVSNDSETVETDDKKETEAVDIVEEAEENDIVENFNDGNVSEDAKEDVFEGTANESFIEEPIKIKDIPAELPKFVPVDGISLSIYNVTLSVGHTTMPYVTMSPKNATDKGEIWQSSDESVATVDYIGNIKGIGEGTCVVTVTSTDNKDVYASVNVNVIPEAECTYIDGILIANKTYPLPQSYAPGWDAEASDALQVMFDAAKKDGISLFVKSGYRSYIDQKIIYNDYVKRDGQALADTYSARPGHSEHQTGLAFDLNSVNSSFANTPEAKWIAENCYKYGFIVRYPKDKEQITGYIYEPWHVRYLGVEKAQEVFESGLCLEEFLGITSVYLY